MGSRANYIIKTKGLLTIYYNKWGACQITQDLYSGENNFFESLKKHQRSDSLIEYGWMEGLVIADIEAKHLAFWSFDMENETSVLRYFMANLQERWPDWQLIYLPNYIYDAAPLMGIDYISGTTIYQFKTPTEEEIINDGEADEYPFALVLIRDNMGLFVTETNYITLENIISYGTEAIPLLKRRKSIPLPHEGDARAKNQLFIDVENKHLVINDSIFGLWETMSCKWPEYTLKMGCMGYLAMLAEANINIVGMEMSQEKVLAAFEKLIKNNPA